MNVYRNAVVLTMDDNLGIIRNGCVVTEGDRIVYVGEDKEFPGAVVRDCAGKILMPGFVNGHTHLPMTLFRGFADDLTLHDWLNNKIFPLESRHTPETMRRGAMLAAAELIRGGVTTVNDMYYDGRIIAETLKETGLSGIVSTCLIGIADDHEARFEEAKELAESYRMDPSIRTAIAPHAEYTTTVPLLERWVCEAVDTGQPVHIHCSETESEHEECKKRHGVTPVGLFHRIGLFEVPALLAHCVWTDESDIELIATNGASVLHNPCSNMKLGSGFSPIPAMLDRGIRIALSSDGAASNNSLDMWEEMRIAALIHKGRTGDATAVSSAEALYMATRGAAIALGFADRGSVAAGQRADFIVIDPRQPSYFPKTNLMNLIVYSGNSRDIELTVAGGDVLYDRGTYTKLDIEKVYSESEEAFRNVFGK